MRTEDEIRQKIEDINKNWDNANDIIRHGGNNPVVGGIVRTLQWTLEELEE